jgi:flagellar biosynthesis GTPase FlhF
MWETEVRTDILKTYKLTSDFSRTGFYASKEWDRLEENLVEHMRLGHFVALTGPVGVGKTTLIHKVGSPRKVVMLYSPRGGDKR